MRHFFRDIAIAAFALTGAAALYRARMAQRGPLVRVVVFHDVTDSQWFAESIALLKRTCHLLTPEAFLEEAWDPSRTNVLLTFDDGYASWTKVCLPVLREQGCQGLFFVNSGLLGAYGDGPRREAFVRERLRLKSPHATASWDDIRALQAAGHMIGGHTSTHPKLSELPEIEQEREIFEDKRRLEVALGTPITAFAYPFGGERDFTASTAELVTKAGYRAAFTTEARFAESVQGNIPRLCLENGMSTRALAAWVGGAYDLYTRLKP